jgi:hypothetical protein
MNCPVCGANNEANAAFCFRCGSSLKGAASTGPTVNLNREDHMPQVVSLANDEPDDHGAKVYDVPSTPAASTTPTYDTPASSSLGGTPYTPSPPQYNYPAQGQQGSSYSQPPGMMVMPQQNSTALIALILAIVSFVGLSLLGAIPAVILGRNARKEIQASNGMMTGDGMAQAAVILGWINIGLSLIGFCVFCAIPFLTLLGVSASG